jgi:hypothetical protein
VGKNLPPLQGGIEGGSALRRFLAMASIANATTLRQWTDVLCYTIAGLLRKR